MIVLRRKPLYGQDFVTLSRAVYCRRWRAQLLQGFTETYLQ